MKNRAVSLLLAVTILFVGITVGLSLGRSTGRQPVQLSILPKPTPTAGTATDITSPTPPTTQETAPLYTGPVNVNTADLDALITLPGIGPVLAQRIISYRQSHGAFRELTELLNVEGIGEKRLEAILDYVTVGG